MPPPIAAAEVSTDVAVRDAGRAAGLGITGDDYNNFALWRTDAYGLSRPGGGTANGLELRDSAPPAAGAFGTGRQHGAPPPRQSPKSFCFSSRRCCASRDRVAVGRASSRGMPIGSPVSSQKP